MSRPPKILQNDIKDQFCDFWFGSVEKEENGMWGVPSIRHLPLWIDDILSGVARLDYYSSNPSRPNIPLSTIHLITIFTTLDEISTSSVAELLGLARRQASRYAQACRLAYPFLKRVLESNTTIKYPSVSFLIRDSL